jgi:hypothetical protein
MPKRPQDSPHFTVKDNLCTHPSFGKDLADSAAQIVRCKGVFTKAKAEESTECRFASSLANWGVGLLRIGRPDDIETGPQWNILKNLVGLSPDHYTSNPQFGADTARFRC